jgi:hypothetical protein
MESDTFKDCVDRKFLQHLDGWLDSVHVRTG